MFEIGIRFVIFSIKRKVKKANIEHRPLLILLFSSPLNNYEIKSIKWVIFEIFSYKINT